MSDEADLVEAAGAGAELFEAPALFYLTHAEAIRRWSALGQHARDATNAYLTSLQPDLQGATPWELAPFDTARSYRHLLAAPPGAPLAEDESPAIACCFGWNQRAVRLTQHTWMPFVGVRVGPGAALDRWRRVFLEDGQRDLRPTIDRLGYRRDREWPAWKQVIGGDEWWADLDGYRAKVVAAFEECVGTFGPEVERTVAALAGPGRP